MYQLLSMTWVSLVGIVDHYLTIKNVDERFPDWMCPIGGVGFCAPCNIGNITP
jgi:hypothetical protein